MDSFQAIDRHDSRHDDKMRDIKQLVARMGEQQAASRKSWEAKLGDTLDEVVEENVLRGGGDRSILHGSALFRSNYEQWLRSLK